MAMASQWQDSHGNGERDGRSDKELFDELVSTLPKQTVRCIGNTYHQYRGFWYVDVLLEGIIWAEKHFKAQDTDIFVASVPKSGTTWGKALAFATMNRNQYDDSSNPLLTQNPHVCVPFVEFLGHQDILLDPLPTPRLLSLHTSYNSLPKSIVSSGSKIIYICRNPKDVFASYYHFLQKVRVLYDKQSHVVEEMFDFFCRGVSLCCPYWDHVLGYWNASVERPDKVLFLKYEDMKADTEGVVKKIAEFIGRPFSADEESNGAVMKVVKLCSLETLRNLEVNKTGEFCFRNGQVPNNTFFRQGKVGDFRSVLTEEMINRIDQITEQHLTGTGLKL